VTTPDPDPPLTDTSDMVAAHDALRHSFASAPAYVGSVSPGDADRAALVGSYYANVLAFLTVHHGSEDVLLWPRLLERLPDDAALVRHVSDQHSVVHAAIADAESAVATWTDDPDSANAAALLASLRGVEEPLVAHLAEEEAKILPLAARALSPAEWGEIPAHAMQHFSGDKMWLVQGMVRDNMTQEQRDSMLAHMPPPAVDFWVGTGEGLYKAYLDELAGR
jgi:anti-sigma-K factor RskA